MAKVKGKKILLGVCGGIAAYKAAFLIRLLVKEGAEVQVVMTPDAVHFITPLTLSTLSGRPVYVEYFDADSGAWNNHVELALWADLLLVAPATAHTLAKFAHGICDNLLVAVYLSAKSPVWIAPAMDLDMWKHGSTRANIELLESFGNRIVPPGIGELASGLLGEGRLAEPEEIVRLVVGFFEKTTDPQESIASSIASSHAASSIESVSAGRLSGSLFGKKVLVSAGPTYEAIDPVRFIGNHSSGKMGIAIAEELLRLGADVFLVHGPVYVPLPEPHPRLIIKSVVSASGMFDVCREWFPNMDAVVMAAAVADYTPRDRATKKIKKSDEDLTIPLSRTTDILATLGAQKRSGQILVGFALETDDELANAQRKLDRKNLDFIVLNSLQDQGAGFGVDTNVVTVLGRDNVRLDIGLKSKKDIATEVIHFVLSSLMNP